MRKGLAVEDLGNLLELPLVAVLATYRRDGGVLLSPVWHEWRAGGFGVVTRGDDVKVAHLRRDPRASITVYEHEPPYRGVLRHPGWRSTHLTLPVRAVNMDPSILAPAEVEVL